MAKVFPPIRTESRIPKKVLVELHSSENATHEITSTVNVSLHGIRALTKGPWALNQDVSVRSFPGHLHSRAHVVYCKPLPDDSFSVGLELLQPTGARAQQAISAASPPLIPRRPRRQSTF